MNRPQRIAQAKDEFAQALQRQSSFDVDRFCKFYPELMPELRRELLALLQERKSFQADGTLVPPPEPQEQPSGDAPTVDPIASSPPEEQPKTIRYVGDFRLERLLGDGAFGEVWQGVQMTLNRKVAVKLLKSWHTHADLVQRFRREAKLLGKLSHPNIVSVIEVGEHQGTHFIAMEYVPGTDLKGVLARGLPTSEWSAKAMVVVAQAMAHAHQANLIHRDLKPANILVNQQLELKITDFGLAKEAGSETDLTTEGALLGTISYMAPEQAAGKASQVGPAADIYAIGATLYHFLADRPPFPIGEGLTPLAIVEELRERDPVPPRKVRPEANIPRDLEVICLKCLEKEPAKRYASATALAADLQRFLDGDPILARSTPWWEKAWRRIRKRPLVAGLSAAVVLVALVGTWVASSLASKGKDLAKKFDTSEEQRSAAEKLKVKADEGRAAAEKKKAEEEKLRVAAEEATKEEAKQKDAARDAEAWKEYIADIQAIETAWSTGKIGLVRDLLAKQVPPAGSQRKDLRGIEWYYWQHRLTKSSRHIPNVHGRSLAFATDGKWIATADESHVTLWNLETLQQANKWEIAQGRVTGVLDASDAHRDFDHSVAFSPDGKLLAATTFRMTKDKRTGFLKVWELPSGVERLAITNDSDLSGRAVAFFDNNSVAAGCYGSQIKCWNVDTKASVDPPQPQFPHTRGPTFAQPGTPWSGKGVVWDIQALKPPHVLWRSDESGPVLANWQKKYPLLQVDPRMPCVQRTGGPFKQAKLVFGLDNRSELFAGEVNDDNTLNLQIRDNPIANGVKNTRLEGGQVTCVTIHDRFLAAAGNNVVRVWDVTFMGPPEELRGSENITGLAFRPGGKAIAALGGGLRIWNIERGDDFQLPLVQGERYSEPNWHRSPGGKYLAARTPMRPLKVIAQPDQAVVAEIAVDKAVLGEWFSPDERYLAVSMGIAKSMSTVLWDLAEKREVAKGLPGVLVGGVSFSPDSKLLAIHNGVWETSTGQKVLQREGPAVTSLFSPSGKLVAFAGRGPLEVWDVATKTRQQKIDLPRGVSCQTLAFDPSETRIATAPAVTVWDLTTGEQIPTFFGNATAKNVAFSSDGRRFYVLDHVGLGGSISVFSDRSWNLMLKFSGPMPRHARELDGIFERIRQTPQ